MTGEIKKPRHFLRSTGCVARVRESTIRRTKLVEEWVDHCLDGRKTLCRGILKESRDQVDSILSSFAEHLDRNQSLVYRNNKHDSGGQSTLQK